MGDTEINIWILVTVALIVWIARLKLANRKLEKQVAAQAALPVPPTERPVDGHPKTSEIDALKARLQVLERIAVDKEHSLVREIDRLRDR